MSPPAAARKKRGDHLLSLDHIFGSESHQGQSGGCDGSRPRALISLTRWHPDMGGFVAPAPERLPAWGPTPALARVGAFDRGRRRPDPLVQRFGEGGQARSLVDRIADNGVFVTLFGTDVAGEHRA